MTLRSFNMCIMLAALIVAAATATAAAEGDVGTPAETNIDAAAAGVSDDEMDEIREVRERFRSASPEERRAMRQTMRERFKDASPAERKAMRQQMRAARGQAGTDMTGDVGQRRRARMQRQMKRWKEMPEDVRRAQREKLREMTPAERHGLRARLRALPPEEKRDLDAKMRAYQSLDPAEQQALRNRLDQLMVMPPEERARVEANERRWKSMSDEERTHRRQQMQRLKAMDPDERARLLEVLLERAETAPLP